MRQNALTPNAPDSNLPAISTVNVTQVKRKVRFLEPVPRPKVKINAKETKAPYDKPTDDIHKATTSLDVPGSPDEFVSPRISAFTSFAEFVFVMVGLLASVTWVRWLLR